MENTELIFDIEEIKIKYPSMCYDCYYARQPASLDNLKDGWVGCAIGLQENIVPLINISEIEGEGWISNSAIDSKYKGGMLFNDQLLTKCTKKCNLFLTGS